MDEVSGLTSKPAGSKAEMSSSIGMLDKRSLPNVFFRVVSSTDVDVVVNVVNVVELVVVVVADEALSSMCFT